MRAHLPRKAVHLSMMDATYSVQRRAEIVTRSRTSTTVSVPNLNVTVISKKRTTQPLAGFQAPVWACDVRKFLSAHQGLKKVESLFEKHHSQEGVCLE